MINTQAIEKVIPPTKPEKVAKIPKEKKPKKRDFDNIKKPSKPAVTVGGRTTYLTNKELMVAIVESKAMGKMSDKLAAMLVLLCSRYAKRSQFAGYTYNDDMQAYAMLGLLKTWHKFDEVNYENCFAYYTQILKNYFRQYLNQEKRHRDIRDMLLVEEGMNPSFGFTDDFDGDNDFYNTYSSSGHDSIVSNDSDGFSDTDEFDILDVTTNAIPEVAVVDEELDVDS